MDEYLDESLDESFETEDELEDDFDITHSNFKIKCPSCNTELVGDENTTVLMSNSKEVEFECGNCHKESKWKLTSHKPPKAKLIE